MLTKIFSCDELSLDFSDRSGYNRGEGKFIYSESFLLKRPNALWSRTIGCRGKRRRLPVWKGAMSCNRLSCRFSCSGKAAFHCGECMDEKYGRVKPGHPSYFSFSYSPIRRPPRQKAPPPRKSYPLRKKRRSPNLLFFCLPIGRRHDKRYNSYV